jgi:hypothetical protein
MKVFGPLFSLTWETRSLATVGVFVFCQVIGAMCTLPDLSVAEGMALLMEEEMACPMDGTIMCPPSLTSSPERQINHLLVADVDHTAVLLSPISLLAVLTVPTPWSWSSVYSIVPLSIGSSSVLRI